MGLQGPPGTAGGQSCWDLNGNNIPDIATEDTNGDGNVNILDCRGLRNFGNGNLFMGLNTGVSNNEGIENTFIGEEVGTQNSSGNANTFIGYNTGITNTTGSDNTFIGQKAGQANTTGFSNTFIGKSSGETNSTGNYNAFLGYNTGLSNTTGNHNTYVGQEAGKSNQTGSRNTFIGHLAGLNLVNGSGNIYIGTQVGASPDLTTPFSEDNMLRIHNGPHPSPLILGDFDERRVTVHGEIIVTDPIRFQPTNTPSNPTKGTMYYDGNNDKLKVWTGGNWENLTTGSTDRISKMRNHQTQENSLCQIACINELSQKIHQQATLCEQQQELLKKQQEQIIALQLQMERLVNIELPNKNSKTVVLTSKAFLAQNHPNPLNEKTIINYVIPDYINTANIQITSFNGTVVKRISLENTGAGELVLQTEIFSTGIYYYSLVLDGVVFETKQMIITR